jgi:hypothetical protein
MMLSVLESILVLAILKGIMLGWRNVRLRSILSGFFLVFSAVCPRLGGIDGGRVGSECTGYLSFEMSYCKVPRPF